MKAVMWLVLLVLSCFVGVRDCKEVTQLRGYFGGEVSFRCPFNEHRKMIFLYLQKGTIFVNGYYDSEDMEEHDPWPNSRVDREHNIIYLHGLNISHSGVYSCVFEYDDRNVQHEDIELTVTANYSEPSLDVTDCPDKHSECLVKCSSYGGYPKAEILWQVHGVESPSAETWGVVRSNGDADNNTKLYTLSSIAAFNCSSGQQQNISCSAAGTGTYFSICEY